MSFYPLPSVIYWAVAKVISDRLICLVFAYLRCRRDELLAECCVTDESAFEIFFLERECESTFDCILVILFYGFDLPTCLIFVTAGFLAKLLLVSVVTKL